MKIAPFFSPHRKCVVILACLSTISPSAQSEEKNFGTMQLSSRVVEQTGSSFCRSELLANEAGGAVTNFTIDTNTTLVSYETNDPDEPFVSYLPDAFISKQDVIAYRLSVLGSSLDDDWPDESSIEFTEWNEKITVKFALPNPGRELIQEEFFEQRIAYKDGTSENCTVSFVVTGGLTNYVPTCEGVEYLRDFFSCLTGTVRQSQLKKEQSKNTFFVKGRSTAIGVRG